MEKTEFFDDDYEVFGVVRVGFLKVLALLIIAILMLAILTGGHASASEGNQTVNSSYVVVEEITTVAITAEPSPTPRVSTPRRIDQGACVVPGETIDIAGIGWYTGRLVYYGRYYDGYSGAGNSSVVATYSVDAWDLDTFYLDTEFFSAHYGWWYQVDPIEDTGSSHGNDRMFRVSEKCNITPAEKDEIVKASIDYAYARELEFINKTRLPEKRVAGVDAIISRNMSTSFAGPTGYSRLWIFGPDSSGGKYYDIPAAKDSSVDITRKMADDLNDGDYSFIFIYPGSNTIVEERYDASRRMMTSPFKDTPDLDISGYDQAVVRDRLITRIVKSSKDDTYVEKKVALQDPVLHVAKLWQDPISTNKTRIMIGGYTNALAGDIVRFQIDADRANSLTRAETSWSGIVSDNGGIGAYRTFNGTFIIDFKNTFPGQHSITITTANGASATIPVYFRQELPEHFNPPEYTMFVDNSPFLQTPTPEIIIREKIVPGPTQIVTVTITPSVEQIHQEGTEVAKVWFVLGTIIIILVAIIIGLAAWLWSVYRRARVIT